MRKILGYLGRHKWQMTVSLSVKVLASLLELLLPYILKHILDDIITPLDGKTGIDPGEHIRSIVLWAVIMIVCAFFAVAGNVWANRRSALVARNVAEDVRNDLFRRTLRLSPAQTDAFTVPSLESRLTTDTYNIHNFINMMQRMGIRAPILLIGGLAVTSIIDIRLTAVMAAVLPLIFVSFFLITSKGLPMFIKVQKAVDGMIRVVREDAQGIRVIKALSKADYENRRYDAANKGLSSIEGRTNVIMSTANPFMNLFMNGGLVAVVFFGARLVNGGVSEVGSIIAFIQYFTMISGAMMAVTRIFVSWSKASASAERIDEVLRTGEGLPVCSGDEYPGKSGESGIAFEGVNFGYSNTKEVLHDISFSLPEGGKLGIIGATGSGKTTVISLLMRFYDVGSGSVRINGRDVRTIPEEELHSMFGVVMQNDFIRADSVSDNIRFDRDIPDEKIRRAAAIAQADGFIRELEGGYDYLLSSKGTNVSGGQRQRILIARALAGDPGILILDDSSSALDYRTDADLRRAIAENLPHTTTVTVAQRVSSVMSCDLIIVLDEGRITGMGDHGSLLENCPVYRQISESQMGGAFLE